MFNNTVSNIDLYLYVQNPILKYTFGGFCFGMLFPLVAWFVESSLQGLGFTLESIYKIHITNKIIIIIDSAPFVLGFVFYFLGKKQQRLIELNIQLNTKVSNQGDIIKNNLAQLHNIKQTQSHFVRRPVSNIIGLISLLNMTELSDTQKEILEQLTDSSKELDDVIREIVQQSKEKY